MNKYMMDFIKRNIQYLLVIVGFVVLAYTYAPQVFQGKIVNQSDIASWRGMANEIVQYNEAHPDEAPAIWTNSMFSGMPANAISIKYDGDNTDWLYNSLFLGMRPPSYLIISLIGAFLMFLAFGANIYISVIGAIAVTFCSYNFQLIQVGHNSKMVAIAFVPWVMAAMAYAYRGKALLGSIFFAFALSFQIKANHPQITYYLAIILLGYIISELYNAIREKTILSFSKRSALLLIFGLIGIGTNLNHLLPTYEYAKHTMRGGAILDKGDNKAENGLDIAYATQWSYSPSEMPNLMIPNYNGGASVGELSQESETYKVLSSSGVDGSAQIVKQLPLYWGPQIFTAGPMYMGAISVFLFVLGLLIFRGARKWWILSVTILAILLSWGSNLIVVTQFFFNYIPLYNKFRTVSMVLIILQILLPLLGFLTLDSLIKEEWSRPVVKRSIIIALSVTAGFAFIMMILPSIAGSFVSSADAQYPDYLRRSLIIDRMGLLRADATRSFVFIMLSAITIWLALIKKIGIKYFYIIFGLLVVVDMWGVDKRYLNDSNFVKERDFSTQYAKRPVDEMILSDKSLDYRVLDLTRDVFNDAHTSFWHKSIGGYSPAKLQRYQDMISIHIVPDIQRLSKEIPSAKSYGEIEAMMSQYKILNMLNTRYIILGSNNAPIKNPYAMGNAWFVDDIQWVDNPNQEIAGLSMIEPSKTAVVSREFESSLVGLNVVETNTVEGAKDTIWMTSYSPNKLEYRYKSDKNRLCLFSEVYYPVGWRAYIDGSPIEIVRANYVLRGLKLPAGEHDVQFLYSPDSMRIGVLCSRISSMVLLLFFLLALVIQIKNRIKNRQ